MIHPNPKEFTKSDFYKQLEKRFEEYASKKYGSKLLNELITLCASKSLITEQEKGFLNDVIRKQFRNGFSHADMNQILRNTPPVAPFMYGNITNPNTINKIDLSQTQIHVLQPILQEGFANQNALTYFKYVYKLLISIETRLKD